MGWLMVEACIHPIRSGWTSRIRPRVLTPKGPAPTPASANANDANGKSWAELSEVRLGAIECARSPAASNLQKAGPGCRLSPLLPFPSCIDSPSPSSPTPTSAWAGLTFDSLSPRLSFLGARYHRITTSSPCRRHRYNSAATIAQQQRTNQACFTGNPLFVRPSPHGRSQSPRPCRPKK